MLIYEHLELPARLFGVLPSQKRDTRSQAGCPDSPRIDSQMLPSCVLNAGATAPTPILHAAAVRYVRPGEPKRPLQRVMCAGFSHWRLNTATLLLQDGPGATRYVLNV